VRKLCVVGLSVVCLAVWAAGADWHQFQGPDRNGISPETNLARSWGETGPKELWSFELGVGFGGPSIHDGKVYVLDRVDDARDVLRCLDLESGKELWTFAYDAPGKLGRNGSRTTPTVDDKYVYTVGPFGEFHCVSKTSHKVVWKKHLLRDFGGRRANWGVSQSPVLYKDMVIVAPQSRKAGLAAFRKDSGRPVWQSPPIGKMAYASPLIAQVDGADQVIMQSGDRVVGADPRSGKILWTFDGWKCKIPIPCPTPIGNGRFFVTGGYNAGCAMFKVARDGEQWSATKLFANHSCGSQIHNALLYEDHLYANSNNTSSGLVCLDLDGNLKWKTGRSPGFDIGNLILADGLIYILDGARGVLRLAEATPEGYKELAQVKVLSTKMAWAPMALSDGKLVVRDQKQMKCLDVRGQ